MYHVYILKSLKNGKRYVGQTSKEALERPRQHNSGTNKWTKENGPFNIMLVEDYPSRTEAIKRENFLKSGQGRKWLDEKLLPKADQSQADNIPG
jgi:putative endonuclease